LCFALTKTAARWWSYWIPAIGPVISGLVEFAGVVLGLRMAESNTRRSTGSFPAREPRVISTPS
jgi:hypothetical protein